MKYLPMMTEDEVRYTCGVIPSRSAVGYFQRNPKEFAKICPGFRASAVARLDVSNLLFRNRSRSFIAMLIEKHIEDWLTQIQKHIDKCIGQGDTRTVALLKTLPHCVFIDNIALYFKLTGEECAEEALSLLITSIRMIKDSDTERDRLQTSLNENTSALGFAKLELERSQSEQDQMTKKLGELQKEIKLLKKAAKDHIKDADVISSLNQVIGSMKKKEQEYAVKIQSLVNGLKLAKDEQHLLEQRIREEISRQKEAEMYKQDALKKLKRPKDLDEFKEYLSYNFEDIGIPTSVEYYPLLKDHLSEILFQGKPIIISRSTGFTLMRCVSNTLLMTTTISTLEYSDLVTEKAIDGFLAQEKRLLCLDNFIGNYNETTLQTICDKHRDKIIFLTVAYDHTLAYVSGELLRYCHYINLNRIEGFIDDKELTEDPSSIDEEEAVVIPAIADDHWSGLLRRILKELGVQGALVAHKGSLVTSEIVLCRMLAFDVLPYCTDILKLAPFVTSESLVKYAGVNGRCIYRMLFRKWFT